MSSSQSISSEIKPFDAHDEGERPQMVRKCTIAGDGDEFVIIGDNKYYRHELMQAFGGTFNPGLAPYPKHQFGNPASVGLVATGMNILITGLYFANAKGIHTPNVVVGLCMFMGGLIQFLAGLWGFLIGSQVGTFILTVFTSYGAFWFAFGAVFIPNFGIMEAYADDPRQLSNAIGFLILPFAIFTSMLVMCVMKSTLSFFWSLFTYDLTIILFACGFLLDDDKVKKAAGIMAVINCFADWFEALSGTATRQNSYFIVHEIPLPDLAKYFKRKKKDLA
ncbi:Ammonia transport outward protein 2 [Candida viswanathii]|uniref:Ammonia transport outward protein 2 n=1 Tax=Candida viswanathii TaxID=5486 RepID=A0A367YJ95_9ASCO|nr:Ammonia transport outward protein 2 [Candida viswanathii]